MMQESKFCVKETDSFWGYTTQIGKLYKIYANNHKTIKHEFINAVISKVLEYLHRTNVLQKITNIVRYFI